MTVPTVVVDASAIGAILFAEPKGDAILERLRGCDLTAPAIIRCEVVSIAMKKNRARPGARQEWPRRLRRYPALLVNEQEVVPAQVFALALETGLSAYHASYLWLARRLGVALITLDGDLARAGEAAGSVGPG